MLGIALLVTIIGTPTSPAEAMDAFRNAWVLSAVAGVASAAIAVGHLQARVAAPEPAPALERAPTELTHP